MSQDELLTLIQECFQEDRPRELLEICSYAFRDAKAVGPETADEDRLSPSGEEEIDLSQPQRTDASRDPEVESSEEEERDEEMDSGPDSSFTRSSSRRRFRGRLGGGVKNDFDPLAGMSDLFDLHPPQVPSADQARGVSRRSWQGRVSEEHW